MSASHDERSGRGLARLLLRKATQILVDHGVLRIHCDTTAANAPMIHLFESEGWTHLPRREAADQPAAQGWRHLGTTAVFD